MGQPEKIDVASFTIEVKDVNVNVKLTPAGRAEARENWPGLHRAQAELVGDLERRMVFGDSFVRAQKAAQAFGDIVRNLEFFDGRHERRIAKRARRELRRMVRLTCDDLRAESRKDRAWFYGDPKRYALERYERRCWRDRLRRRGERDVVVDAWFRAAWRAEMLEQRRVGKAIAGALSDTFQSFGWPITRRMLNAD